MKLDKQICSQARVSRDPRFDGKFFIAVAGSKVYCRSICPAPRAKEKNCRYFATAAAAEEAGYRPCLRCRPECSPGTPAWMGTSNTVSRALRLIEESGLEDGGVETLADRLGIGSRHLRRLFLKHLGATPSAVARVRRLHFVKKLIDETSLPMSHVALAAGFGCVRRFNAAVKKTYHRTPMQIRRIARKTTKLAENEYLFRLGFRPPYHWEGMLAFLAPRAIPGVEAVDTGAGIYRRNIFLRREAGYFEASLDKSGLALSVRIQFGDSRALFLITERIRRMFDVNADWQKIAPRLRKDAALARRMEICPGLRVPGCWDGFELAVRAILGQQVTVKGASTLAGRLVTEFGSKFSGGQGLTHLFPRADVLADARLDSIGLPAARAETIRALARAVCDGKICFEGIVETEAFLEKLCEIPGIGKWTAQYVAMRALGEPDAFPVGDLGLAHALEIESAREIEERSQQWRPWRAYATMYLWSVPGSEKVRGARRAAESEKKDAA
jgi:AraC family transcriptional regulator, regulatory protein of adaptative response / DNA-3-methyladenine glycosylase II